MPLVELTSRGRIDCFLSNKIKINELNIHTNEKKGAYVCPLKMKAMMDSEGLKQHCSSVGGGSDAGS